MAKAKKKGKKLTNKKKSPLYFKIDKTASLWNQLRTAWIDFHKTKTESSAPATSQNVERFELLIENLLKQIDEELVDEKHKPKKLYQLTVDKNSIPEAYYPNEIQE